MVGGDCCSLCGWRLDVLTNYFWVVVLGVFLELMGTLVKREELALVSNERPYLSTC